MEQLRQRFRDRLAARVAALRAALADIQDAPDEAIAALRRIGHALHGSGGTYGFPQISEAAREVEYATPDALPSAVARLLAILEREQHPPSQAPPVILLIDDDPEIAALLSAIVAPLGATVICVGTAAEARVRMAEESYAVVVLDLMLPDADGRTVLLWMREQERLTDTPVFVMSGLNSARVQAECYSIGADGFFEKPIDPDVARAAIAARLADRHARPVELEQDSGADAAGAVGLADASDSADVGAPPVGECTKIVLVEDDDLVASIIRHRLSRAGYEIEHFADGVDARDGMTADGVCLVILDIKIPGIDGFELLEILRGRPAFARIPVIILTALNSERDVVRGLGLGASDYMVKPFSPTELLARVNRLLQSA